MARVPLGARLSAQQKEGGMHTSIESWDWLWMTLMMGFWLVVLGAVIYTAVRLAQRTPPNPREGV